MSERSKNGTYSCRSWDEADAFDAFIKWCISFGEEVIMYGWRESDELQLHREMKLKNGE